MVSKCCYHLWKQKIIKFNYWFCGWIDISRYKDTFWVISIFSIASCALLVVLWPICRGVSKMWVKRTFFQKFIVKQKLTLLAQSQSIWFLNNLSKPLVFSLQQFELTRSISGTSPCRIGPSDLDLWPCSYGTQTQWCQFLWISKSIFTNFNWILEN